MKKTLWLSLGQNCLSQEIINTLNLDTEYTIFSWSKSTVDQILSMEKNDYEEALKISSYIFDEAKYADGHRMPFNPNIVNQNNDVYTSDNFYFETTHLNIIESQEDYEKLIRRHERLRDYLNNKEIQIIFLYHYSTRKPGGPEHVRSNLKRLLDTYYHNAKVVMFSSYMDDSRGIDLVYSDDNLLEFQIRTNLAVTSAVRSWAMESDRDLHQEMIDATLRLLHP